MNVESNSIGTGKQQTLNLTAADNSYQRQIILIRRCGGKLKRACIGGQNLCVLERPRSDKPRKSQNDSLFLQSVLRYGR